MRIDFLTIFPQMLQSALAESILGIAQRKGLVRIRLVNLRDFTHDRRRTVDDRPYGGGPGMVLRPEPIFEAVELLRGPGSLVILMTPQGRTFRQSEARRLALCEHLILICGAYEGIDERVRNGLVDEELSIGDYVLTNGSLAALVVVDAVTRLVPGVLGDCTSVDEESFSTGLLEYPQYTRPADFRGMAVPEVLRQGHHGEIARWRQDVSRERTRARRPDLWADQTDVLGD
ncbi:MAG: tRNA (guanosine(37)-N1)-methyltransferase TrmD [Verrucomicrobiota bacterium]|nr:tRNA (guanosine(37)-N1)-methyltransferase TrmD [Verrucomicrobiota bacterium]MDD8044939.1 tRNA (guanosine(37)-N1)-methyltransferase TrmD [Verrucomicrobiota bacterium]MDD8051685.1 tRNA (guanosine(37)-N1)-methyltransferase TrmD [Verrucomicrobiota bacterium]MDI9385443.1 tRNA (guanosine(37)-N1)-methyltransferase TrmD [Verrucomicrobiota bacterium]HCF95537.1 tRNA (guanosine(37)-N1)-methyltransferase TrmD [Verrucomicrobiota bacterium]